MEAYKIKADVVCMIREPYRSLAFDDIHKAVGIIDSVYVLGQRHDQMDLIPGRA